jgi:hypothetical protein
MTSLIIKKYSFVSLGEFIIDFSKATWEYELLPREVVLILSGYMKS